MKYKKIIIILILLIIISFYLYYQNNYLQITNYSIENTKIPKDFNNYKIIQISDFHNTKSNKITKELINTIKQEQPNIIVITGDLIDSKKTNIDISINLIEKLSNIAPIYYINGNHEISSNKYSELKEKLTTQKVTILENQTKTIKLNNSEINLIGINDPTMNYNPYSTEAEIIKSNLKESNYNKENYSILLSHRPEAFNTYVKENIDLVLTGHAHGGQIRLPFIGGVIAPNQGFFPKYTSNKHTKENTTMIVSRGIGNSIIPFRINNRPELVIIDLNN